MMLDGLIAVWLYSGLLMLVSDYESWVLHGVWQQTKVLMRVHDQRIAQQRLSTQLKTFLAAYAGQQCTLRINDTYASGTVLIGCQKNHKIRYRLQKQGGYEGVGLYARLDQNSHYQLMVPGTWQWQWQCLNRSNRWLACHPNHDVIRMVRMTLIPSNQRQIGQPKESANRPWSVLINLEGTL